MAKWLHEDVYKNGSQEIKDNAVTYTACGNQPITRNEAISTYKLVDVSISSSDFSWSETSSGWLLTVAAKTDIGVDSDGEITHVAIVDSSRLLLTNITEPLQVYAGGLFNFPSFGLLEENVK